MHIYSIQLELISLSSYYYCIKISLGSMCAVLEKTKTKQPTLNRYALGKEKKIEIFYS